MERSIRVIIFNADEEFAPIIREQLLKVEGAKIIADVDDVALLPQALNQFQAEVVIFHLDPGTEQNLPIACTLATERPDLAVFAVSGNGDAQLVLTALRGGLKEYLTKPIDQTLLEQGLVKAATKLSADNQPGTLISMVGSAGGVGVTTLATNIAVELADITGQKVALVDLDFRFGQVATLLDLQPNFTIADLCETTEALETQLVERAMVKYNQNLHVLARPNHFVQADSITAAHCVGVLNTLQGMYKYVVLDGPNRFDLGGKAVFDMADLYVLVFQLLVPSVRNAHRMIDAMMQAGYNPDRIKLVCNRIGRESGNVAVDHVESTLNQKIFASIPDEWRTISSSINIGEPLVVHGPKAKVRLAIRDMAERLHRPSDMTDDSKDTAKSGGLLSKIFANS